MVTPGTRPTSRSTNARGKKTRERIERAALELFAEHGFEDTTVDAIVAAANVSQRTFFHHFPTKIDVLWGDSMESYSSFATILYERPEPDVIDALLAAIIESNRATAFDEVDLIRFQVIRESGLMAEHVRNFEESFRQMLAGWLARRLGRSADDVDVRAAARGLDALRQFAIEEWARRNGDVDLDDLVRTCLHAFRLDLTDQRGSQQ
ncbi:MAG: TetR family transcriptional regulator [Actinomycetota bacterium]